MKKNDAKVFKHGNSQAITLSQKLLYQAGLNIGDRLLAYTEDNKVIFEKQAPYSIKDEILEYYRNGGTYDEKEFFDDKPKGHEIW